MSEIKKCKVAFCKCGIRVQMASTLPEGDTDMDILKEYAEFAKLGRKIDYMPLDEMKEIFGGCYNGECHNTKQLNLKYEQ